MMLRIVQTIESMRIKMKIILLIGAVLGLIVIGTVIFSMKVSGNVNPTKDEDHDADI
jgi:hypothetical protein